MLSREQVRSFYGRFGSKQDWQRFYEGRAIGQLLEFADFAEAHAVLELGCGTGWFAADLLAPYLPKSATYLCLDLSSTMVNLTQNRLLKYGKRAEVRLTDGSPELPLPDSQFDRFVSNYVFDLLPPEDIHTVLEEAHRVLVVGGRLCLTSLTHGFTFASRAVVWLWKMIYNFQPTLVRGCRPLKLLEFVSESAWQLIYHNLVIQFGIPSEIVVARK